MNRLSSSFLRLKAPLARTASSRAKSEVSDAGSVARSSNLDLCERNNKVQLIWHKDGLRIDLNNNALKAPFGIKFINDALNKKETSQNLEALKSTVAVHEENEDKTFNNDASNKKEMSEYCDVLSKSGFDAIQNEYYDAYDRVKDAGNLLTFHLLTMDAFKEDVMDTHSAFNKVYTFSYRTLQEVLIEEIEFCEQFLYKLAQIDRELLINRQDSA